MTQDSAIATVSCYDGDAATAGVTYTYTPAFAQYGFRYFSLAASGPGVPADAALADVSATATFMSTLSADATGAFACSHATLAGTQALVLASARSNWMSIPTDCPTREKAGWLGDAQIAFEVVQRNWGAAGLAGAYKARG